MFELVCCILALQGYHYERCNKYSKQETCVAECGNMRFPFVAGENINLSWSPDGQTIAVGNKEDLITFIDVRTCKTKFVKQFNFEVNEFSWNKDGTLFLLTTGQGSIIIHR